MKNVMDYLRKIEDSWYLHLKKSDERKLLLRALYECDEQDFEALRDNLENDIKASLEEVEETEEEKAMEV